MSVEVHTLNQLLFFTSHLDNNTLEMVNDSFVNFKLKLWFI